MTQRVMTNYLHYVPHIPHNYHLIIVYTNLPTLTTEMYHLPIYVLSKQSVLSYSKPNVDVRPENKGIFVFINLQRIKNS